MRTLIILFLILIALYAFAVTIGAFAIFIEEENIAEVVCGEVWDDAK